MRQLIKTVALCLIATLTIISCAEDTGSLGIYSEVDGIKTSVTTFSITTNSTLTGKVIADNTNAYLGKVIDPETGAVIEADFATQFYCLEDYSLPEKANMIGDIKKDPVTGDTLEIEYGKVQCDSCEVQIFLKDYYGDGNNPMKLEVYLLDSKNIMEESTTYYTDINLKEYLPSSATPIATKVFTPIDYSISEEKRKDDSYTSNIRIRLPKSFGQDILEKGYEHPENLKNPYLFVHEVFPGLYFRISSGEGTMLTTMVSKVDIYYDYCSKKNQKEIYQGVTRFAATPEVIQSTHIANGNMEELMNETGHTYLKTPAGICTELQLPIDEVFDQHPTDSVSKAQIDLIRYNSENDKYVLGTPASLLMVRKQDMQKFFAENKTPDGRTSYLTSFDASHNLYSFSNISRLLAYCKHEKIKAAKEEGLTEEQWVAKNPDWNKVVIIPVVYSSNSSGVITNVSHDMGMNSAKLVGGDTKLQMQVIYSKFN